MAEPRERNTDRERRNEEFGSDLLDEDITGRANEDEGDEGDEFDDTEELDEEDLEESDR